MTNSEVRAWYLAEVASIPHLDSQWQAEGIPLPDRARRAWEIRHRARAAARAMMTDPFAVEQLRKRDLAKYGDPDGPTFEQLFTEAINNGSTEEQAYQQILSSSVRTDMAVNRRFSQ